MSGAAFLRVEKLKGGGIIAVAARHNKREIQGEMGASGSIDPTRSHLNFSLAGPPTVDGVAQLANDLMHGAGRDKLRKDAVRGIEAVFSLPVNTGVDVRKYFADCLAWAAAYFGGAENILSFDVHMDEAAPHAHALVLPLVDGRMDGSAMYGARSKLLAMQSQFHELVAKRYGLRKAPPKLTGEAKRGAVAQVLNHLRRTGDAALQSLAWANIRGYIENDPGPLLLALGLVAEQTPKAVKPFVDYVTSKGKGPTRERKERRQKPIGFPSNEGTPKPIGFPEHSTLKKQSLCSGGFAKLPTLETTAPAPNQHPSNTPDELGEIAAPATATHHPVHQKGRDGQQPGIDDVMGLGSADAPSQPRARMQSRNVRSVARQTAISAPPKLDDLEDSTDYEPDTTHRERDGDHEAGQWCPELGEFIQGPHGASKKPPRAMRASLEDLVAGGLVSRGRAGASGTVTGT